MKRFKTSGLLLLSLIFLTHCASSNYIGKFDVYGVGAGPEPAASVRNAVDAAQLKYVKVGYTPKLATREQDVGNTTKKLLNSVLTREYSGQPKFLADWLNEEQKLLNAALLLDKNGVIAWQGSFDSDKIQEDQGVEGYKLLGGRQYLPFYEAFEKYVKKEKTQKYKKDKQINFDQGFFESGKEGPFVYARLPDFSVQSPDGSMVDMSTVIDNGKPTLLIFFLSQERGGKDAMITPPGKLLKYFESTYFFEK